MAAELLSASQAAEFLGIHHSNVRRLADQGRLRGRKAGSYWVFSKADLERFKLVVRPNGRPAKRRRAAVVVALKGIERKGVPKIVSK